MPSSLIRRNFPNHSIIQFHTFFDISITFSRRIEVQSLPNCISSLYLVWSLKSSCILFIWLLSDSMSSECFSAPIAWATASGNFSGDAVAIITLGTLNWEKVKIWITGVPKWLNFHVANIGKIYSLLLTLAFAWFRSGTSFQLPCEGKERNCFLRNIGSWPQLSLRFQRLADLK